MTLRGELVIGAFVVAALTACKLPGDGGGGGGDLGTSGESPVAMRAASLGKVDYTTDWPLVLGPGGLVAYVPKQAGKGRLWKDGHRVDVSADIGASGGAVTAWIAPDGRMGGFGEFPNGGGETWVRDARGVKSWVPPPPQGIMWPFGWTSDDRIAAAVRQGGITGTGQLSIVLWGYGAYGGFTVLPESTRVYQEFQSTHVQSSNSHLDYVLVDGDMTSSRLADKVVFAETWLGGTPPPASQIEVPFAVLEDRSVVGATTNVGIQRQRGAEVELLVAAPAGLRAVSPRGDVLWIDQLNQLHLRRADGSRASLPVGAGAAYFLDDDGRVLLLAYDQNLWLYTPTSLPNPLGETRLTFSAVQGTGLVTEPLDPTSLTGFVVNNQLSVAVTDARQAPVRELRLQGALPKALAVGDTLTAGGPLVVAYGDGTHTLLASAGSLQVTAVGPHTLALTAAGLTFSDGTVGFTLDGPIEIRSFNDP